MQQSNIIFAALLIAYILLITQKGELGTYIALLRGSGTSATSGATSSALASGLIDPGQIVNSAGIASDLPGVITSLVQ